MPTHGPELHRIAAAGEVRLAPAATKNAACASHHQHADDLTLLWYQLLALRIAAATLASHSRAHSCWQTKEEDEQ